MSVSPRTLPQRLRSVTRRDRGAGRRFGLRLAVAFVAATTLVGIGGYVYIDRQLRSAQTAQYLADHQADARTLERFGARASTQAEALRQINLAMDLLAGRAGTRETLLIGRGRTVVSSADRTVVGERDTDVRIEDALSRGRSYAGREADTSLDTQNFELVTPVVIRGERYAFEVSFKHQVLDQQLDDVRRGLLLVGLLALLGAGGAFYLFGGRTLLRAHRRALGLATLDGLTELPNQRAFRDELPQAVAAAVRNGDALSLIALDVDDFKFMNDRHGHQHGDSVLIALAAVLREARPGDRAFRVGGDEFVVLLPHTDVEGARFVARRLHRSLGEASVTTTIGLATYRLGTPADIHAEADAALYEGKRRGGNAVTHFDDVRDVVAIVDTAKVSAVHHLIDEGGLATAFQPIWNLGQRSLLGLEALSRPDPGYGLSGPAEAFDIAEQIDRVHDLDVLCVRSALAAATALPAGALLFINVCPRTLDLDGDRSDWLLSEVARSGLAVDRVVIEVTERFGGRAASIIKCLHHLRAQGFKLAIDDVGTGNSGLAILRQVPVDFVKLDRTIVTAASTEHGARAVLLAIAAFARQTGSFVIAEGIEDHETLAFVRSIEEPDIPTDGVIQGGQGYGLGRPTTDIPAIPLTPPQTGAQAA